MVSLDNNVLYVLRSEVVRLFELQIQSLCWYMYHNAQSSCRIRGNRTLFPFQNDKQGNCETQYYQEHEHNCHTGRNHYKHRDSVNSDNNIICYES